MLLAKPVATSAPRGQLRSLWAASIEAAVQRGNWRVFRRMPPKATVRRSSARGRMPSVSRTLKPNVPLTGTGRLVVPLFVGFVEALIVYSLAAWAMAAKATSTAMASAATENFLRMSLLGGQGNWGWARTGWPAASD